MAWSPKATKLHPGGLCLSGANIPPNVTPRLFLTLREAERDQDRLWARLPLSCASAGVRKRSIRYVRRLSPSLLTQPSVRLVDFFLRFNAIRCATLFSQNLMRGSISINPQDTLTVLARIISGRAPPLQISPPRRQHKSRQRHSPPYDTYPEDGQPLARPQRQPPLPGY